MSVWVVRRLSLLFWVVPIRLSLLLVVVLISQVGVKFIARVIWMVASYGWTAITRNCMSVFLTTSADGAPRNARSVIGLEGLLGWFAEHLMFSNGSQPVGLCCREEVAGTVTTALDERTRTELLQTRSWRRQRLTSTSRTSVAML